MAIKMVFEKYKYDIEVINTHLLQKKSHIAM
jgi:hypothetical protein